MKATGILFLLVAIFVIINAGNLSDVIQGKAHFNFIQLPNAKVYDPTTKKSTG